LKNRNARYYVEEDQQDELLKRLIKNGRQFYSCFDEYVIDYAKGLIRKYYSYPVVCGSAGSLAREQKHVVTEKCQNLIKDITIKSFGQLKRRKDVNIWLIGTVYYDR